MGAMVTIPPSSWEVIVLTLRCQVSAVRRVSTEGQGPNAPPKASMLGRERPWVGSIPMGWKMLMYAYVQREFQDPKTEALYYKMLVSQSVYELACY